MKRLLRMLSGALLVTACEDHSTFQGRRHDDLISQTWALRRLNGVPVPMGADEAATLRFMADRRVGGSSTCNRVFSPERWWDVLGYEFRWDWPGSDYRWSADPSGKAGSFGPAVLAMTAVGCGNGPVAQSGEAFWKAMQHARRWSLHDQYLVIDFVEGNNAVLISQPSRTLR